METGDAQNGLCRDIKVQWAAVTDMTSEKALYVVTPDKRW